MRKRVMLRYVGCAVLCAVSMLWVGDTKAQPGHRLAPKARASVPALIKMLQSKNPRKRGTAAMHLGFHGAAAAPAFALLERATRDQHWFVRAYATRALARLDPLHRARACKTFVLVMQDRHWMCRVYASEALGKIKSKAKQIVPLLARATQDANWQVRTNAFQGLGNLGMAAFPTMKRLLAANKSNIFRLYSIVQAFGEMGPEAYPIIPQLIALFVKGNDPLKKNILIALEKIGLRQTSSLPPLITALNNKYWTIRSQAARTIATLGQKAAMVLPQLYKTLQDKHWRVQRDVVYALGFIKSAKSIPHLLALYAQAPTMLKAEIIDTYARMQTSSPQVKRVLQQIIKSKQPLLRKKAFFALALLSSRKSQALKPLIQSLKSNRETRLYVLQALAKLKHNAADALPEIIPLLRSKHKDIQQQTSNTILAIGPKAIQPLIKQFQHKSWWMRKHAATTIARFGTSALAPLQRTLSHPSWKARMWAAYALGKMGKMASSSVPALKRLLRDRDQDVRKFASFSIRQILRK